MPHASRPSTSVKDDNIEKNHIVVRVLGMKRVAARLVPKDLNFSQKERRVEVAKQMLANVADDPTFIKRIISKLKYPFRERTMSRLRP